MDRSNIILIKKRIKLDQIFQPIKQKTSRGWKCLTPFQQENTASFIVEETESGDKWTCYSTKQSGDVIKLYELINKCNTKVALYELAKMAGLEIENIYIQSAQKDDLFKLEMQMIREHSFFKQKGISEEMLNQYGVGYVDDISKFNLSADTMFKYSLHGVKDSIVYLFKDGVGRNIGFSCRPLSSFNNKYITHSPMQVWGMHKLTNKTNRVIVVEGYNDVLKLRTEGIENVISASGTNFTQKIFNELREHNIKSILIIPDGDLGGYGWIEQIINKYGTFDTYGISVEYAMIPFQSGEKIDPDEYVLTNRDFFTNPPARNPIVDFYDRQEGSETDKIRQILDSKMYLKNYEIQLALKEKLGGIVDIQVNRIGLHNDKYEKTFLLNMVNDRIIYEKEKNLFIKEYFANTEHSRIFEFIVKNEGVNEDTLKNHFPTFSGQLDIDGHNIYRDKLISLYKRREQYQIVNGHQLLISNENMDSDLIVSEMVHKLSEIKTKDSRPDITAGIALRNALEMINEDRFQGLSISKRFGNLDILLGGLKPGKMYYLSGATGNGKTTLGGNFVDCVSVKQKHKTLFCSDEMSPEELALRQLCISAGIDSTELKARRVKLTVEMMQPVIESRIIYSELPIAEYVTEFLEEKFLTNGGFDLIVIDYLQLIGSQNPKLETYQYLPGVTKALKKFIMKKQVPLVAMNMLHVSENNKDIAEASGSSGSKAINNDADVIITITRKKNAKESEMYNTELYIDKHRDGQDKVKIPVYFDGKKNSIYEV